MIRFFDILFSILGLVVFSPLLLIIYLIIIVDSSGGGFYLQERVGRNGVGFKLFKFRTMKVGSDRNNLITIGTRDARITRYGFFIRSFKLDELPQLFNVIIGDMSLVGPRPEVRKYVDLYNEEHIKVLTVRPGLTDYASIEYANENELLGSVDNPEKVYIEKIMPHKIELNMIYVNNICLKEYFRIIFLTVMKIIK